MRPGRRKRKRRALEAQRQRLSDALQRIAAIYRTTGHSPFWSTRAGIWWKFRGVRFAARHVLFGTSR